MTRHLIYLDTATDDLVEIGSHIAERSAIREVGTGYVARLREKCTRLADLPGTMGTARIKLGPNIRSTPYQDYVIYFRYTPDTVEIINVLHASRDADAHFHC